MKKTSISAVEERRMAVNWVRNMKREHSEELGPGISGLQVELDQSSTRLRYSSRLMMKKKKIRRWITVGFLQIQFQLTSSINNSTSTSI